MLPKASPIPVSQFHYADPAINDEAQQLPITPIVDRIHYPTLGCPALLTPDRTLSVLISLPDGSDPKAISLSLIDRHENGHSTTLALQGDPISLGPGPQGKQGRRTLWRIDCSVSDHPYRLFDLHLASPFGNETQYNAVRIYERITGHEKVIFCGDAQYHVHNAVCLERFIQRVNQLDDIAWIAIIGDICDNGVRGTGNILSLATRAAPGPVRFYYGDEYAHTGQQLLPKLNKPVILVPGNHDGMVAYENYMPGTASDIYLGPDPINKVAYDGLHHFRRTFGPLYFAFDWGNTRYLCTNTFELNRHDRLGYHAIVANWGGWMQPEQLAWLTDELADATSHNMHKVLFMHHDPRGGSKGTHLGYYKAFRPYNYQGVTDIVLSYMRYLTKHARSFQQEWMMRLTDPLAQHPVKTLLTALLDHHVWAVVMGHDNENWIDSYFEGDGIFAAEVQHVAFPSTQDVEDASLIMDEADLLADGDIEQACALLADKSPEEAHAILEHALERLDAEGKFEPKEHYAPDEVEAWDLRAKAPIHFTHVDDIGAYKYSKAAHFQHYGYAVAQLSEGRPVSLQRYTLYDETARPVIVLPEE